MAEIAGRIFAMHWYDKKQADYGLNARLRMVALNAVIKAATADELAPEAKLALNDALMELDEWLGDKSKLPGSELLHKQLGVYFETGSWPGAFEPKPLPPGSPI